MSRLHRWGVEIEAFGLRHEEVRDIVEYVTDDVCIMEERTLSSPLYWVVTYDGSIQGDMRFELRTPAMTGEKESWDKLRAVCKGLREAGAHVNKSCGIHVHHDVQYMLKALASKELEANLAPAAIGLYARLEPVLDEVMPLSRRYSLNEYCKSFRRLSVCKLTLKEMRLPQDLAYITDKAGELLINHYMKLSLEAMTRHGTLEYRQHSGTLLASKIIPWVKLTGLIHEKIADIALKGMLPKEFVTLEEALAYLGASEELAAYWLNRRAHFSSVGVQWPSDECICPMHKLMYYSTVERIKGSVRDMASRRPPLILSKEAIAALPTSTKLLQEFHNLLIGMYRKTDSSNGRVALRTFLRETLHVKMPLVRSSIDTLYEEPEESQLEPGDGIYIEEQEAEYMQLSKAWRTKKPSVKREAWAPPPERLEESEIDAGDMPPQLRFDTTMSTDTAPAELGFRYVTVQASSLNTVMPTGGA